MAAGANHNSPAAAAAPADAAAAKQQQQALLQLTAELDEVARRTVSREEHERSQAEQAAKLAELDGKLTASQGAAAAAATELEFLCGSTGAWSLKHEKAQSAHVRDPSPGGARVAGSDSDSVALTPPGLDSS